MDIGSIFLILALLLMVALYVSRPLLEGTSKGERLAASPEEHTRSALLAERDRILTALQELDFDYALGKIPEEDYPLQRKALLVKGAEVLKQLDALQPPQEVAESVEDRLEAAIARRRMEGASPVPALAYEGAAGKTAPSAAGHEADDDLEVMLAQRRRARQDKSAGFCARCGAPLQKSDRFCPKCGNKIS